MQYSRYDPDSATVVCNGVQFSRCEKQQYHIKSLTAFTDSKTTVQVMACWFCSQWLHCRTAALRGVPLQVLSERSVEAQAAGQQSADCSYVAVSVAASVDQVYLNVQVMDMLSVF